MRQRMTTAELRLDQGSEASNSTIWLPTRLVVAEFSCSAPQRDRKLPSTDRESGECRFKPRPGRFAARLDYGTSTRSRPSCGRGLAPRAAGSARILLAGVAFAARP